MKLKHVVITAVARDDLQDGGADHFARTITAIREMDPSIIIEVLVPGFSRAGLVHPDRARRRARHLQSQHGNSRAPDAAGPFARKVSDLAGSFASVEGVVA